MTSMLELAKRLERDICGATAIEYALIAVIIAVGLIFSVFTFGGDLFEVFNRAGDGLSNN